MIFSFLSSCTHLWYYNPHLLSSNEIVTFITYVIIQPTYYQHMKKPTHIINIWCIIFHYNLILSTCALWYFITFCVSCSFIFVICTFIYTFHVIFIRSRHVHISLYFSYRFHSFLSHAHLIILFVSFSLIFVTCTLR